MACRACPAQQFIQYTVSTVYKHSGMRKVGSIFDDSITFAAAVLSSCVCRGWVGCRRQKNESEKQQKPKNRAPTRKRIKELQRHGVQRAAAVDRVKEERNEFTCRHQQLSPYVSEHVQLFQIYYIVTLQTFNNVLYVLDFFEKRQQNTSDFIVNGKHGSFSLECRDVIIH